MKTNDLHWYAQANLVEELRAAIRQGVNINEKNRFGSTALHRAIAYKSHEAIALLLEHGADVTAQSKDGGTALHYAIEYNLPHVAAELVRRNPAVVAIADKHGNQPLWTAVFNARGNYEIVSLLLRYGADPLHRNNVNLTPLDSAKIDGDNALLQIFESKEPRQPVRCGPSQSGTLGEEPMEDTCPDCGTSVGQLHEPFCPKELCPFCGDLITTCECIFQVLSLTDDERKAVEMFEDDSVEPLQEICARWNTAVNAKGRVPFGTAQREKGTS